eukprot:6851743-Prymnesium_polylepis.2
MAPNVYAARWATTCADAAAKKAAAARLPARRPSAAVWGCGPVRPMSADFAARRPALREQRESDASQCARDADRRRLSRRPVPKASALTCGARTLPAPRRRPRPANPPRTPHAPHSAGHTWGGRQRVE